MKQEIDMTAESVAHLIGLPRKGAIVDMKWNDIQGMVRLTIDSEWTSEQIINYMMRKHNEDF